MRCKTLFSPKKGEPHASAVTLQLFCNTNPEILNEEVLDYTAITSGSYKELRPEKDHECTTSLLYSHLISHVLARQVVSKRRRGRLDSTSTSQTTGQCR